MSKSRQVEALTLYQLNRRIAELVTNSSTQNVWVTAELSDVAVRGGHCYMELLQKDPDTGATVAKARAAIWANVFSRLRSDFYIATGQDFATGLKVMVRASVSMHPVYGMSLVINAVNPEYTMGDLLRRRKEMLARLKAEGILDMNRSLCWNEPPLRIAIVSAEGAAGYGDFMNQLNGNQLGLRFTTRLFPAIMQGERTAQSVIAALGLIAVEQEQWDGVVIIRGGGATSDLMGFENYDLAAAVAQFPLPVIVGIGHERDVTILDYVANIRVKTPTAAAEWLIEQGAMALDRLDRLGNDIVHAVRERLAGCKIQLGQMEGAIPSVARGMLERSHNKMARYAMALQSVASKRIIPQLSRLEALESTLKLTTANAIERRSTRLDSMNRLLDALSPMSTLKRGYSITRFNGHAVTNEADIPAGARLETTLAEGVMVSIKQ